MSSTPAPDQRFSLQGVDVGYPTTFHQGHSLMGLFPVSAATADRHLARHSIRAARIWPGRAMLSLIGVRYDESDLGSYDELALTFFAELPGGRGRNVPIVSNWSKVLRGTIPSFAWHLPVTTELSRDGGVQMWGFPKIVADITVAVVNDVASVTWLDGGDLVLRYSVPAVGNATLGPLSPPVITRLHDQTHVSHLTQTYGEVGRHRTGGELELGQHPVADDLRELGIRATPMLGVWNGRLQFEMSAPTPV